MAKKMLRKQRIAIQKLEERVLFDAAGAAEIVEAAAAADAAAQGADAQDAQEGSDSSDDENGAVTAPPEDAAANQEGAETEVQVSTGADAAEHAVADDNPFDASAALNDNTDLADTLSDASDADTGADADAADTDTDTDVADADTDAADAVADTDGDGADDGNDVVFADAFGPAEASPEAETRELVIISEYVKDQENIISQLDENTDVLVLKHGENPLDQINEYLDSRDGVKYSAVHVVSHGNAGYFLLNDSIVDARAVADDPASWKAIGEHLTTDGDIMIYGCNVAGSEDGRAMIAGIADLTGADVAASAEKVGSANGWDLEYAYGIVDTQNIVIDNVSWNLGAYTVYEWGADGVASGTKWDWTHTAESGKYDFVGGQLVKYKDGGEFDIVAASGTLNWCVTQSATDGEASTITFTDYNLTSPTQGMGNIRTAVNDSGLTITAGKGIAVSAALSGTLTESLNVTAENVSLTGTATFSNGADLAVSLSAGTSAQTMSFFSGGKITLNEGSTFSLTGTFSEALAPTVNFGAVEVQYGANFSLTADVKAANFGNISGDGSFSVSYGADFDQTASFGSVSSVGSFSVTDAYTVGIGGAVEVEYGDLFNVSGNTRSVTFGDTVSTYYCGTFNIGVQYLSTKSGHSSQVTFGDDVLVREGSFSVTTAWNTTFDAVPERSRVTFNGDFTVHVQGTSEIYARSADAHIAVTGTNYPDNPNMTTGKFDFTGESGVVFNGDVSVQGNVVRTAELDISGYYINFGGDLDVGTAENDGPQKSTLTVGGFNYLLLNGGLTVGTNAAATFTAEKMPVSRQSMYGKLYTMDVNGGVFVDKTDATLTINDLRMSVNGGTGVTFDLEGTVNGSNSELILRNGVTLAGMGMAGGRVDLDSVRFEGAVADRDDLAYLGRYGTLGVYLDNNESYTLYTDKLTYETKLEDNYFKVGVLKIINRNDDTTVTTGAQAFKGATGSIIMDGAFANKTTTVDFEVGSLVDFVYGEVNSTQYVLAGQYASLTILGTAERDLLGDITVGVSDKMVNDAVNIYAPTKYTGQVDVALNKLSQLYRGGMTLGTTLVAGGHGISFYGFTTASSPKAYISSTGLVSYHVTDHTYHVTMSIFGPISNPDHTRTDAEKAFFGGTYKNLALFTPTGLAYGGTDIVPQDTVDFSVDVDATVTGNFAVQALRKDATVPQHIFNVTVSSKMVFEGSSNVISLTDANLHFTGTVDTGTKLAGITATRSEIHSHVESDLDLVFDQDLGNIGALAVDDVNVTFNGKVERVTGITAGKGSYARIGLLRPAGVITFNDAVDISGTVSTAGEANIGKTEFYFNGKTTGSAAFNSLRSIVAYNYDGDQTIFQGTYDDFEISGSGVKTSIGNTTVGGVFNGNTSNITVSAGTFVFSTFREDAPDDPHRPVFTVNENAVLQFKKANTSGVDFYGTITAAGEVQVMGLGYYHGAITLEGTGTMTVDDAAVGSVFDAVVNKGTGFVISKQVTVSSLHNYGTLTVQNSDVRLDVYNHNGASLVFDLKSGTQTGGIYEFTFARGEGTAWDDQTAYAAGTEVTDGAMYVAAAAVPAGLEPGVEYWRAVDAYSQNQTYNAGDLVYSGTTVYRAVRNTAVKQAQGGPAVTNADYWTAVATGVAAYAAGNAYDAGDYVSHSGTIYFAATDVAANTAAPGVAYWTPVAAGTANRLVNGGSVSVTAGRLTLDGFTQGDKDAQYGGWTYGGEAYGVGSGATLVLNTAAFNSGNVNPPGEGALLGNIDNAGTFDLRVGLSLKGNVVNAQDSRFIVAAPVAFRGSVSHDGAFVTGNAGATLTFANAVSGSGTVGEAGTGYAGAVEYTAASSEQISQRILDGIYDNTVTIGGNTAKTIDGTVVFNDRVENAMTIGGTGSVTFNGVTAPYGGVYGKFTGKVNAAYGVDAAVIYAGTYGDLEIRSGTGADARSIAVELAAANLTVSGDNTFEEQNTAGNDIALTVDGNVILTDNSNTVFHALHGAAVISGAPGSTAEFASSDTPDAVVDRIQGTALYTAADDQTILSGIYGNLILTGGDKLVSSNVTVSDGGTLTATANSSTVVSGGALLEVRSGAADMGSVLVTDGSTLSITGSVAIDAIRIDEGSTLALSLSNGALHRLGTVDPDAGGVTLGGQLTVTNQYAATGTLTIYKWQDLPDAGSAAGLITIDGTDTTVVFAEGSAAYGAVMATVECINGTIWDSTIDPRLQNQWIIIDGAQKANQNTWDLDQPYTAASKFKLINGVTLTVNGFREGVTVIDGVAAILLQDNSVLLISEMADDPAAAVAAVVGDLAVESGKVIFDDSAVLESLTVTNSAILTGEALSGSGHVTFNDGTSPAALSGTGTVNLTGGTVSYIAGQSVYGGTYYDIDVAAGAGGETFTVGSAVTVNGTAAVAAAAVFNGALTVNASAAVYAGADMSFNGALTVNGTIQAADGVGVAFNGPVAGTGSVDFDGTGVTAAYAAAAGSVLGGSYSRISLADNTAFTLLGNMTVADAQGKGTVNDANAAYTVTYTDGSAVYGGTYGSLALAAGAAYTALGSMTVNGEAAIGASATFDADGPVTVRFLGTTSSTGTVYLTFSNGAKAVYAASANVFQGQYANLELESGAVAANQLDGADDGIVVNDTFSLTTAGVLSGEFSFTLNGKTEGVTAVEQTGGVMTYGEGAPVMKGVYNDLTLKSGADADHKFTYTAQGDVTVAGHSAIGQYAVLAAEGSSTISVAGEDFTLVSGRGYGRVWQNAAGSKSVLYQNGRWELLESGTAADWTVGSSIDPFDAVWQTGGADFVTGNMVTVSFTGSTNAADADAGTVDMGDYTAVVYSAGVDMYAGNYFRFEIAGGSNDVLFSAIPSDIKITGDLIVGVADGYYFVFDQALSGVDFSITINGDIWYTNAFLGNSAPFPGSFAGSIRLGGVYDTDHESPAARTPYEGDISLSGITITGDDRYIDATVVKGTLSIENTTFTGSNFQLRVDAESAAGIRYIGDSSIMAIYASDGTEYVKIPYKTLILDGNLSVTAGTSIEVTDQLVFAEGATLTVYGDFLLGTTAAPAALTAAKAGTNYIAAAGVSGSKVDLHVGDGAVVPVLFNFGSGELNLTAGNNAVIAAAGNANGKLSIGLGSGTVNVTAGAGLSVNGLVTVSGGTLVLTAGDNAQFGSSIQTAGSAEITLGKGAVVNGDVVVTGALNFTAGDIRITGEGIGVTGQAVLNFGSDAGSAPSSIMVDDVLVDGAGATLEIAGNNLSVNGLVLVVNGGAMNVTGNKVTFQDDVLNYDVTPIGKRSTTGSGYKWIHDYLFSDAAYYDFYDDVATSPTSPTAPKNPGTITIDSGNGAVDFSSLVVSGGDFNIVSGQVSFNSEFAVAGGTFSVTGGTVLFTHDVYVSSVYGNGSGSAAETHFSITGGSVTVSGNLYNWVRIPVGYHSTADTPPGYAGPFWKDTGDSNKIKLRASLNSSHVTVGGNAQVAVTGNASNIGLWGKVSFTIEGDAQMTIGGNLAVYAEESVGFWGSSGVKYDYLTNLMGFSTGFSSQSTYPLKPDVTGSSAGADFTIDGNAHLKVTGQTWSGAMYGFNPDHQPGVWPATTGTVGQGWTTFTVNSDGNVFEGLFTNSSYLYVNGKGNSFGDLDSNYFMYVNDTNTFGTITNYQDLKITNPGAVVLSLVNRNGRVWISGDAHNLTFANELTVDGGFVSIASELGTPITSPVSVFSDGELVFSAANTLTGAVSVANGKLTFSGKAGGSHVDGNVAIGTEGTLTVSTGDDEVYFSNVSNSGNFVVDGSINVGGVVTNSGKLTVTKVSTFSGPLANNESGVVQVAANGTVFAAVTNAGSFTNAANAVTYGGTFINSGVFVNNTGNDASFGDAFTNSGTLKIDGLITVAGLFTNTSDDVFVYGLADFGDTENSGTIALEPLSGAHEAAVKFGNLTNSGTITSRNDSNHTSDIYFAGTTGGEGSIEGFTGHLYYVYTGTEDIVQTFYANSKYDQVTVSVGNKSVTGEDYSHGLVTLTEDLTFAKLIIDGGNLAIGDADHTLTLATSNFTEKTFGTITVNAGSTLLFEGSSGAALGSGIANFGHVKSEGDLVLGGATTGNGDIFIAEGKSLTYGYTGLEGQTIFGFADGSSTDLIIKGSTKIIAVDMTINSLANEKIDGVSEGADILVKKGVTLDLGTVTGYANEAPDRFSVITEAGDESTDGGTLRFAAGTLNAAIDNAGIVAIGATDAVTLGGTITTGGSFTVSSGAFAVAVTGPVTNSGSFSATAGEGGSVTLSGTVTNSNTFDIEGVTGGTATLGGDVENLMGGTFTAADADFDGAIINRGRFTVSAVGKPVTVGGAVINYGSFLAEGADATNTVAFNGLVTNGSEVVDPETTLTGTIDAVNTSFAAGIAVDAGEFRVGENVSWSDLTNAGLVTINADLTVNDVKNAISGNDGGTIVVTGGRTLLFNKVMTLGGTIQVDADATFAVDAPGTDDGTLPLPDTTGGVKLTGTLINRGTVTVSFSGSGVESVLDIAVFDNGDADSESVLNIGAHSTVVVRQSPYVDADNNPIINGNVILDPDYAYLYFDGSVGFLSVNVTIDGKVLSDFQNVVTNPLYKQVGFLISKTGADDVTFTVDIDSNERVSYTVLNGATLVFGIDFAQQSDLPLTVAGSIYADADSTVRNDTIETELSGPIDIEGTLENSAGNALIVSGDNGIIGTARNGSGIFSVSGTGVTIGTAENAAGTFDAGDNSIGEISGSDGYIIAGDVTTVTGNNGTAVISGDVGSIGANNGKLTIAGSVGDIDTNSGNLTVDGDTGDIGTNTGIMTVAGSVGDVTENAAGASITAGGNMGDLGSNAGNVSAASVGDIGTNSGSVTATTGDVGNVGTNSGTMTVAGNVGDVTENTAGGTITAVGSMGDLGTNAGNVSAASVGDIGTNSGDITATTGDVGSVESNSGTMTVAGSVGDVGENTAGASITAGGDMGNLGSNAGDVSAASVGDIGTNSGVITATTGDVGSVESNSGTMTVAGSVGDVGENAAGGTITAGGSMGNLGTNAGDVSAASVGDIGTNSGSVTATTGDVGNVDTNSGTMTVAGSVGDVGENAAGGTITAGGDMGDLGTNAGDVSAGSVGEIGTNSGSVTATTGDVGNVESNSGTMTVAGNVGDVGENAAGGTITAVGDMGDIGTNAGDVSAASVGEIGTNSGSVTATTGDVGNVGTNSGTMTVAGNVGDVTENKAGGAITADGSMGNLGTNAGDVSAASVGEIGTNSGSVTATTGDVGNVGTNSGTMTVAGSVGDVGENAAGGAITAGGSIGDIESNSGSITQNGNGATIGDIGTNSGSVTVNGDDVEVGSVTNAPGGSIVANGDNVKFGPVDNSGSVTVNGDHAAFGDVTSDGSFTVNGDHAVFGTINSNGDFLLAGNNGQVEETVNSGSFSVTGDDNLFETVSNSGDFTVTGSGNSFGSFANSGEFDFTSSNDADNITNVGMGVVRRDGAIWMMATDEGMNPELFSDGMNKNFSVLAYLTENILDDRLLTEEASFSGMRRIGVGSFGRIPGAQESLPAVGMEGVDLLGIDDDVDEIIFGDSPALNGEELEDVLSGDGEDDGFEAAINEVVGK